MQDVTSVVKFPALYCTVVTFLHSLQYFIFSDYQIRHKAILNFASSSSDNISRSDHTPSFEE